MATANAGNEFGVLTGFINNMQNTQSAKDKVENAHLSDLAKAQDTLQIEGMKNKEEISGLMAQDQQKKADVINLLNRQLSADPTDPNSNVAANNRKIEELNQQLLRQYDAIDMVQQDDGFSGFINKTFNLPNLQSGAAVLEDASRVFRNQNAQISAEVATQSARMYGAIAENDVALNLANSRDKMNAAAMENTKASFDTAKQMLVTEHMTSDAALQLAISKANAQHQAIIAPLELAIKRQQIIDIQENTELNNMMAVNLGMTGKQVSMLRKQTGNNPTLFAALTSFGASGKLSNPSDYELIKPYIKPLKADGTPNGAYAVIQQMDRLAPRITAETEALTKFMAGNQLTQEQQARIFANPLELRIWRNKYETDTTFIGGASKSVGYDSFAANPAATTAIVSQYYPNFAAQTPAIQKYIAANSDTTLNIKPADFMRQLVGANPHVSDVELARQITYYYQANKEVEDKHYGIYAITGLRKPNNTEVPVDRLGLLARMGIADAKLGAVNKPLNPINNADVLHYVKELKYSMGQTTVQEPMFYHPITTGK